MDDWLLVFMLIFFSAAVLVGVLWSAGAIRIPEKEIDMDSNLVYIIGRLFLALQAHPIKREHAFEVTDARGKHHVIKFYADGDYFEMESSPIDYPTLQANTLVNPPRED